MPHSEGQTIVVYGDNTYKSLIHEEGLEHYYC